MGLMDKFKNLFTEEVEEERLIKKEVRHVEIPSPKRSEIVKTQEINNISDSSAITKEEKVITPVYFDDKDFADLEKPIKEREKKKSLPKREDKAKLYGGHKISEEKKSETTTFKPSPIISPVYGVLDKNYFKEDVSNNENVQRPRRSSDKMTIDDIRNKAYGTLEDELKDNLFNGEYGEIETSFKADGTIDVLEELNLDDIDIESDIKLANSTVNNLLLSDLNLDDDTELLAKQLEEQNRKLEEINQMIDDGKIIDRNDNTNIKNELDTKKNNELDDKAKHFKNKEDSDIEMNKKLKKEESKSRSDKKNKNSQSLTDSELFDLVDSMYDEKGE